LDQFARNRALAMEGFENPFASRKRPNEPEELTSRVNTAKISSTKDRLSKPYIDKDHLDVALATNMISVGLDISRLGLVVVLNQPKTAAEYIQATSRVGRQLSEYPEQNKPGLVLVLLNPNRPRDRSHFELFPYWHQTFYRHVEATSCTPFASRALDRGLPGVVVAMARHGDPALAGAKGAMAADALQRIKAQIAQALQDRCIATGAADGASAAADGGAAMAGAAAARAAAVVLTGCSCNVAPREPVTSTSSPLRALLRALRGVSSPPAAPAAEPPRCCRAGVRRSPWRPGVEVAGASAAGVLSVVKVSSSGGKERREPPCESRLRCAACERDLGGEGSSSGVPASSQLR
jgi:hypothetical protein